MDISTLLQAGNCTDAAGCEIFLNLKYFQNISTELQQTRTEVKQQRLGLRTRGGGEKGREGREGGAELDRFQIISKQAKYLYPN